MSITKQAREWWPDAVEDGCECEDCHFWGVFKAALDVVDAAEGEVEFHGKEYLRDLNTALAAFRKAGGDDAV